MLLAYVHSALLMLTFDRRRGSGGSKVPPMATFFSHYLIRIHYASQMEHAKVHDASILNKNIHFYPLN